MRRFIILCIFFLLVGPTAIGQMNFFEGSFDQAVQKAQQEKKLLFVDFYTEWCGPCKMMEKQVFVLPEVGDYMNRHFICLRLDAEAKDNEQWVHKYVIDAYPNMLFLCVDGKELRHIRGTVPPEVFLKEARIATGEELSFEQLYEKYKKNKKDLSIQQELLLNAPRYYSTLKKYEREKWRVRIEHLFEQYMKDKKLENMVNKDDFHLINVFHHTLTPEDAVFDFVVAHFDDYAALAGTKKVSGYLRMLFETDILSLCRKADPGYRERLKRVDGDLRKAYAGVAFGSLSLVEAFALLADATYDLYKHDEKGYFDCMDHYFTGKGEAANLDDYLQAIDELVSANGTDLSSLAFSRCSVWIIRALQYHPDTTLHSRLLVMLGDCYRNAGEKAKARECYNQAFLKSAQIENKNMMMQMQKAVKSHLALLDKP